MEAGGAGSCSYQLVRVITGIGNKLVSDEIVHLTPVEAANFEGFPERVILDQGELYVPGVEQFVSFGTYIG